MVTSRWLSKREGSWREDGDSHGSQFTVTSSKSRDVTSINSSSPLSLHITHYKNNTEAACDIKQLYNVVNGLLIKPEPGLCDCGSMDQLASKLSAFFQDKIRMIQENVTLKADHNVPEDNPDAVDDKLSVLVHATEDEVRRLIKKSPSTSCSFDPMPTWLLKEYLTCLLPTITHIVNLSTGIVPTTNKSALLTPYLKTPSLDKDVMKNFRPIFNLSFISKLTERVVLMRLIYHVSSGNLQEEFQSAYKPNHSTETALTRIIDVALQWFESYLSSRTQTVCLRQTKSDPLELLQGVPQGSVLGPVLFTLYTGPIGQIIRRHLLDFHRFADDSQLYASFMIKDTNDETSALARIQACVNELKAWMSHHRLQLNDSKTGILVITTPSSAGKHNLTDVVIGDSILKPTTVARNL